MAEKTKKEIEVTNVEGGAPFQNYDKKKDEETNKEIMRQKFLQDRVDIYLRWKMFGDGKDPVRSTSSSAGADLHAIGDYIIEPYSQVIVETGLKFIFPFGTYGRIAAKSSLSVKKMFSVEAGVIDSDFQGTIKVVIYNRSKIVQKIFHHDAVAQLICEKLVIPPLLKITPHLNEKVKGVDDGHTYDHWD